MRTLFWPRLADHDSANRGIRMGPSGSPANRLRLVPRLLPRTAAWPLNGSAWARESSNTSCREEGLSCVHSHRKSGLMRRMSLLFCLLGGFLVASAGAQSPPAAGARCRSRHPWRPATVAGGLVHGTVKAGNIPLPGVSIVATNTLTGQRYATVTDINGNYSMTIPTSGRYVLKTELAAFAPETKVALLKPTGTYPG